jgi:class 3 adenylate cyclase
VSSRRWSRRPGPPGDILIVDDSPESLSLLSSMLSGEGYSVRAAISGAMALMTAAAEPPDIVLLDVSMPEMDGYEVCRRLKAEPRTAGVPVIFLSALHELGDKVMAFEVGGVDYVTKPCHLQEVLARVGTQVLLHRQRQELERQRAELAERYLQIQQLHGVLRGYMSDRAWESIAESASSDGAPAPAREVLTILVSDIAGFVRLAEQLSPGPLLADLSLYLSILTQIVYRHGGQVDKYLGDGMLAFFMSAGEAVRAAREIHRSVAAFNAEQRDRRRPAFSTRLGLATGPVLLASIGSSGRREFTLIGDRVNVAARLQAEAPLGGIVMDARTYAMAGSPAGAAPVVMQIKGKQEPETMYEIGPEPPG